MKEFLVTAALSDIDQSFVYEAEERQITCQRKWQLWLPTVACFALICSLALPRLLPQQTVLPPVTEQNSPTTVTLGEVQFLDLELMPDRALSLFFLEANKEQIWTPAQTRAYYGGDLTPLWLPEDLQAAESNGYARVYVGEGGEVAAEFFTLQFYEDYYEDGSPKAADGSAIPRGVSLSASRTGIWRDCILLLPEDVQQQTEIAWVSVQLGYRQMSYGPYDPETHAPAGYYDLYVAEFEKNGVQYELVSEKLSMEEFLTVLSSIILEREDVTVECRSILWA